MMNAFALHDSIGLPLSTQVMLRGHTKMCAQFFCDAMSAGWSPDTALSTIQHACRDNELPFDVEKFIKKLTALWAAHKNWAACASACCP